MKEVKVLSIEQKRFPANVDMNILTFLNNKKINGELYAYLQSLSEYDVINKQYNIYKTYVLKKWLPIQSKMCQMLGIKSPKTLKTHLNYLIEQGYIIEEEDRYILPEMENIYFLIPLHTLRYINS